MFFSLDPFAPVEASNAADVNRSSAEERERGPRRGYCHGGWGGGWGHPPHRWGEHLHPFGPPPHGPPHPHPPHGPPHGPPHPPHHPPHATWNDHRTQSGWGAAGSCMKRPKDDEKKNTNGNLGEMKTKMDSLEERYQKQVSIMRKKLEQNEYETTRLELEREDLLAELDALEQSHAERHAAWAKYAAEKQDEKKDCVKESKEKEQFLKDQENFLRELADNEDKKPSSKKVSIQSQPKLAKKPLPKKAKTPTSSVKKEVKAQTFHPVVVCGPNGCVYQILVPDVDAKDVSLTLRTPDFMKTMLEQLEQEKKMREEAESQAKPKKVRPVVVLGPDGSVFQILVPDIDPSDLALTVKTPKVPEEEEEEKPEPPKKPTPVERQEAKRAEHDRANEEEGRKPSGLKFRTVVVCGPDGTLCHALVPDIDPSDCVLARSSVHHDHVEGTESSNQSEKKAATSATQSVQSVMFRGPDGLMYRILVPSMDPETGSQDAMEVANKMQLTGFHMFDVLNAMFSSGGHALWKTTFSKKAPSKKVVKIVFKEDGTYESHESDDEAKKEPAAKTCNQDIPNKGNVKVTFHPDGTYETSPAAVKEPKVPEEKTKTDVAGETVADASNDVVVETVEDASDDEKEGEGDDEGSWEHATHPAHEVSSLHSPSQSPVAHENDTADKDDTTTPSDATEPSWMEPVND